MKEQVEQIEIQMPEGEPLEASSPFTRLTLLETDNPRDVDKLIGWKAIEPTLRASSLKTLRSCPRKFLFQQRYRLQPKGWKPRSDALDIGDFWHIYMGYWYQGVSSDEATELIQTKIAKILKEAQEAEDAAGLLPGGESIGDVSKTLEQNHMMARMMAQIFIELAENPKTGIINPHSDRWEVVGVERSLLSRHKRLNQPWEGILDVELLDKKEGTVWVCDHKTEGRSALIRAQTIPFETQFQMYRVMGLGLGHKVGGVLNNIMVKCPYRFGRDDRDFTEYEHVMKSGPRKGETVLKKEWTGNPKYENYVERCRQWYMENLTRPPLNDDGVEDPPILQSRVRISGSSLPRELWVRLREADRAAQITPDLDVFYREDSACRSFNRLCPYLSLCRSNPLTWPERIETSYQRAPDQEAHV